LTGTLVELTFKFPFQMARAAIFIVRPRRRTRRKLLQ
jgi:hypothetical protein